jgi:serine/threonine protein kinase
MAKRNNEEPLEMGGVPLHPGSRVGNYVFLREVGSGGMARVLLAKDPAGDLVALKVLRKNRFKTGLARFRREFRALSRIHHPNVIRVEAYGDLHGHPYIAMEYVDGPDLHATIRSFRGWDPERRWTRVEEILVDLCRSLAVVHKRGLVHRDLKPSNVLLTRAGTCKLTDFGIVKDLDPAHDPFLSTTLVGTWAYASPEQITGKPLDHRSDLYSLGVILFAMLATSSFTATNPPLPRATLSAAFPPTSMKSAGASYRRPHGTVFNRHKKYCTASKLKNEQMTSCRHPAGYHRWLGATSNKKPSTTPLQH